MSPDEPNGTKPGWQTTELWFPLLLSIISFLVAVGVIPVEAKPDLEESLREIFAAVPGVFAAAYPISRAISKSKSR